MRWTKWQDGEIISPRGEQSRIGEFIQCCLRRLGCTRLMGNLTANESLWQGGKRMRGAEWPQAGPSRTAVSPVFCCPVEVEEATENRHTSPCQFLIQPGWNRQVSEGQWLKLLLFPILRFISWKKKGEAAKWPGCAIIFWRGGEDCVLGSLLGVACAVRATEG